MTEKFIIIKPIPGEGLEKALTDALHNILEESPDELQTVIFNSQEDEPLAGFDLSLVEDGQKWLQFENIWPPLMVKLVLSIAKNSSGGQGLAGDIARIPFPEK